MTKMRIASYENEYPSPDRSGNPFVRRGGQKIGTDSGNQLLKKLINTYKVLKTLQEINKKN
jgi:hypothetical protein